MLHSIPPCPSWTCGRYPAGRIRHARVSRVHSSGLPASPRRGRGVVRRGGGFAEMVSLTDYYLPAPPKYKWRAVIRCNVRTEVRATWALRTVERWHQASRGAKQLNNWVSEWAPWPKIINAKAEGLGARSTPARRLLISLRYTPQPPLTTM
ncbi:hypothetical protein LX32DRAFT_276971 [Colletotrichum zoysiae]|uniref:Uncharacterized protein n=1 Tax=Colletotrichum zoysiae TaxID=1216348 RepID=A0AAD9H3D0_9PEZI|nr:hypothetical protein LX32DRAFT_276971 [Colletotrichum zoysiae]